MATATDEQKQKMKLYQIEHSNDIKSDATIQELETVLDFMRHGGVKKISVVK